MYWTSGHNNVGLLPSFNLVASSSPAAVDDSTGVSHPSARWGRRSSNEGHHWLGIRSQIVLNRVVRCLLLGLPTNLSDQDDTDGHSRKWSLNTPAAMRHSRTEAWTFSHRQAGSSQHSLQEGNDCCQIRPPYHFLSSLDLGFNLLST